MLGAGDSSPKKASGLQPLRAVDLDKVALILDLPGPVQDEIMQQVLHQCDAQQEPALWGLVPPDMADTVTTHELRVCMVELVAILMTHLADL